MSAEDDTASAVAESAIVSGIRVHPLTVLCPILLFPVLHSPHLVPYFDQSLHLDVQERQREPRRSPPLSELGGAPHSRINLRWKYLDFSF
jgi:hypothetical protein